MQSILIRFTFCVAMMKVLTFSNFLVSKLLIFDLKKLGITPDVIDMSFSIVLISISLVIYSHA
jgi:hypothetical protein